MIEIGDKLVSDEIFEKEFVCNLNACKGACCIEGDDGAPLKMEEVNLLEDHLDEIKPYMRPEGIAAVEKNGVFYMDQENEPVTSLVNGAECAFVFLDEEGITKCSVEQAYRDGKIDFNKPLSCHLYPIRVQKYRSFTALNYDRWPICKDACSLGEELGVPVYRFLKEPLIRAYGAPFYKDLEKVAEELIANKNK
ncbi:DUF3109 family protein [Crocinitomix algicola]|uniref:DUF3109 family protein n=1 Tax=Crocinitomix algicola TaxID=1740263 RepID=UPI00082C44AC|nr:DUF3109 family protein [Crocinitomix algicola]